MRFDEETARLAGIKSGETRRRKAQMSAEDRAREVARTLAPELMGELVKAAKGQGDFEKLDLKVRVQALIRVIEYGVGKPRVAEPGVPDDNEDGRPTLGEDLFS